MNSPFPKSSSAPGEGRIVAKLLPGPEGISALEAFTYQYPLKLISPPRPSESKSVLVFLLSYGGGLVGGDSVTLSIGVQAKAKLSIVTQGHTKVFPSVTPDIVTRQTMNVEIASGAGLCLLPDPVQPFESSVYEQTQVFRLASDASLCLLDWVTQGRTARGEDWSLTRWVGRNEIWARADSGGRDRLLVRDAVILDGNQPRMTTTALRDSMHSMGVVGTLLLRGPMVKRLGEFFLAEFAALPRLGSRDFRTEDAKRAAVDDPSSPLENWRLGRLQMEKENKLLWSAANVRGCVVVKFGAPAVEASRLWIGSMLTREGTRCLPQNNLDPIDTSKVMSAVRQPLMETSDNTATSSPAPTSSARRSGRVTKAPNKFTPDAPAATKRKRATEHDDEDGENQSPNEEEDVSGDEDEDDDDDTAAEEPRSRKRKPSSQNARAKKPAAKKPKINGDAPVAEPIHAARLPSRPKKTVRIALARPEEDGLYTDIFGSGYSSDKVATDWYHKYQADDTAAVTDLVNCILTSAGCDQHITADDIRDPENCSNRLADLQNVYADVRITDYPLISRDRSSRPFRDLLIGFFRSLVIVMHETDVLYKDAALMENIARWVASMSSSTLRPFRHTATTVALAMEAALVEVAKKLDDRITKMTQQVEAEKTRKGKNKDRLHVIEKNLQEADENRKICQDQISDFFETVFVHRYRDIDPKIRTECVEALGSWIWLLPTVFMKPEYLRYLGWMLSDVMPQTRQEVLKQLARLFKRDAEKLGHFTDRFRPRLVEMATKDSDVSVRVAAITVIQILKDIGMLEPDEIDSIGRLIYDSELRVRRAVIDFFAGCVNDSIETKIESMGGNDAVDELFGDEDEDDYFLPRRDWISIKCLAELLAAYDAQLEEESLAEPPRGLDIAVEMVQAVAPETRISLASQVLYDRIDQVKNWELLSGYLLYDHTASSKTKSKSRSKGSSNEAALRDALAPEDREEPILLEVLSAAVKQSLASNTEVDKSRRKARPDESPEDSAVHLAQIIPRLLKKFGAEASTAVVVLRLEHSLDLDIFQQLRQDSTTYTRLLDEICTQFDRHVDRGVVAEAATALLHARRHNELEEITDAKIVELWETVINALRHFDKMCELSVRGNLDEAHIAQLGYILLKSSKLASIANPIEVLEAEGQLEGSDSPAIDLFVRMVHRGRLDQVDEALDDLEDEAVSFAVKCSQFYFMWKVRSLIDATHAGTDISARDVGRLETLRKTFETNLVWTLSSRGTNDDLRLFATGGLCDLHVVFATLRQQVTEQGPEVARKYAVLEPLFQPITPQLTNELIEIFDSAERAYARCIKRSLNEPAEDEDPIDDDQFSDDDSDDDLPPIEKKGKELKNERALCELAGKLVLTIAAKMVDQVGPNAGKLKRRMLRNQNKLGHNLKETLSYLDESKLKEKTTGGSRRKAISEKAKGKQPVRPRGAAAAGGSDGRGPLSEIIVGDGSDDDEEEEVEDPFAEEGTVEDLRRRGLLDEEDPIEDDDHDSADDEIRAKGRAGGDDIIDEDESISGD
ncbi:UreD urease accessory protein-domain-containing protein [Podospora didyma]|uniref:UreD urease accessory protein-domain-containing protein n=1 Tax=Podospora didyma TaxID=330526 RepID=A0AAE0KLH7_9PEZI|nr:UreD urease accessory protein-domain-containing protein [Podospora didyma]